MSFYSRAGDYPVERTSDEHNSTARCEHPKAEAGRHYFQRVSHGPDGHQDNRQNFVIKALGKEYASIEVGELWEVTGEETTQSIRVNGLTKTEPLITASHLCLLKPSGSQIVQWLADNKKIHGVGAVKAQKLWDALGEELYDALDQGNGDPILTVLGSPAIVQNLLAVWTENGDTNTLRWMQKNQIQLDLARKVIRFHGTNALEALQEDPYRLLSFSASWEAVDSIARQKLDIMEHDPRRLRAAVEQALYDQMDKGHTCADKHLLKAPLKNLLGSSAMANDALALALENKSITQADDCYQSAGAWLMEQAVAEFVRDRISQPEQHQLFGGNLDDLIDAFENEEALELGISEFRLNDAQRTAVKTSFKNGFSVITGGAGVGKTTVLKALYRLLDTTGRPRFQMALSGRAAKRMLEATGERAFTIAGFLKNVTEAEMGDSPIIIVDEASMVDLATMYRLIRRLPPQCQMVLVGDPYQLPPIGAGLVLHCLTELDEVPVSKLNVVKRQSADSAIPRFAGAIRKGMWPDNLSSNSEADVSAIECDNGQMVDAVLSLYEVDRENTQILAATRSNPFSGFNHISRACCYRYTAGKGARSLRLDGEETGFYEGDLLLYTRNDWQRDLQNGLLGRLVEVFDSPQVVRWDDAGVEAIGWAKWEGRRAPLLESDVEWLEYGYAISIHKSQGSQFKRVIVPITKSRLLDRTLLYTAVTRAQEQVILVGNISAMEQAVVAPPMAHQRRVSLPQMLERSLGRVVSKASGQSAA